MTESEAVALVRMLWNLWGEERIAEQMGQDTLDRFKRVLMGISGEETKTR
jgi:hypothetical protein